MKEIIGKKQAKKTPLIFKCKCGTKFISNEWRRGMMLPSSGMYPDAKDTCIKCGKEVKGGRVFDPVIGSEEWANLWAR
jgi:hypothetical protein